VIVIVNELTITLHVWKTQWNYDKYSQTEEALNIPPEQQHPLLINLKFSKKSGMIVYHCRTVCKNFRIFNETGKDFVLIQ
jgi:hypothetical protein